MTNEELFKAIEFSTTMAGNLRRSFARDEIVLAEDDRLPADVRPLFVAHLSQLLACQLKRAQDAK